MEKLTIDDLYTLRDACIHAEQSTKDEKRKAEYSRIFKKLGTLIIEYK